MSEPRNLGCLALLCICISNYTQIDPTKQRHSVTRTAYIAEFLDFPPNLKFEYLLKMTPYTAFRQQCKDQG